MSCAGTAGAECLGDGLVFAIAAPVHRCCVVRASADLLSLGSVNRGVVGVLGEVE